MADKEDRTEALRAARERTIERQRVAREKREARQRAADALKALGSAKRVEAFEERWRAGTALGARWRVQA